MVSEVLEQSDHPLQVAPGDAVLLIEPVPVPGSVSFLEPTGRAVAYVVLPAKGNSGYYIQMKVTGVVDGDAAGLEPEFVGVGPVLAERVVDSIKVVLRPPGRVGVHHDLDVGVVLVIVVDRLDERPERVGNPAAPFSDSRADVP